MDPVIVAPSVLPDPVEEDEVDADDENDPNAVLSSDDDPEEIKMHNEEDDSSSTTSIDKEFFKLSHSESEDTNNPKSFDNSVASHDSEDDGLGPKPKEHWMKKFPDFEWKNVTPGKFSEEEDIMREEPDKEKEDDYYPEIIMKNFETYDTDSGLLVI